MYVEGQTARLILNYDFSVPLILYLKNQRKRPNYGCTANRTLLTTTEN